MAIITLTDSFANLNDWPGNFFEGRPGTSFTVKTATSATIKLGGDNPFKGFTITAVGTGFDFNGKDVLGGTMTSVSVKNKAGGVIFTIDKLAPGSIASDFQGFAVNIFGFSDPNGNGNGPDGTRAWSHLLSGNDTILGTDSDDRQRIPGIDVGNDTYKMLGGNDRMNGGIGNDRYDGGSGFDTLDFGQTIYNEGNTAIRGVVANLKTGTVLDPWGATDRIISIESIIGSVFKDSFIGGAKDDEFSGLRGADTFDGGAGKDTINYDDDVWRGGKFGIVADLETSGSGNKIKGTVKDGFGNTDTTLNIENVQGTRFDDVFKGSSKGNVFYGGEGKDSYDGGGNPVDSGESDRIQFNRTFTDREIKGVSVDLARATGQVLNDGFGNKETAIGIEGVVGAWKNDILKGDSFNNLFAGADGKDVMTGRGGRDEYVWWDINHFGDGDSVTDFDAAADKLSFQWRNFDGMTGNLSLVNGTSATSAKGTFIFNTATDILSWDKDGTGSAAAVAVVKLAGVDTLSAANFELY
jgi:serralysin